LIIIFFILYTYKNWDTEYHSAGAFSCQVYHIYSTSGKLYLITWVEKRVNEIAPQI